MSLPSKSSVQTSSLVSCSRNEFPLFAGWRKYVTSGSFSTTGFLIRERGVGKIEQLISGGGGGGVLIRTGVVGKVKKLISGGPNKCGGLEKIENK